MSHDDGDRDLREAFQAARDASLRSAPPFRRTAEGRMRGPAKRRAPLRWGLVAAAAAFGFLLLPPLRASLRARAELKLARQVMAWRSSTDFLLTTSFTEPFAVAPGIGHSPAGSPLRALDPGGALAPPQSRSPL